MPDGRLAYENIRGREYTGLMFEFGMCVRYKVAVKAEGGVMQERWKEGVWLGKRFALEEHIVLTQNGKVVRSPAVKVHPARPWSREEFDKVKFDKVKGVPWDLSWAAKIYN